jgi:hypothetical protein
MLQVSTDGTLQIHVLVWKYPILTHLANHTGQSGVLYMAVSPDGEGIVIGARDGTTAKLIHRIECSVYSQGEEYFLRDHIFLDDIYTYSNL